LARLRAAKLLVLGNLSLSTFIKAAMPKYARCVKQIGSDGQFLVSRILESNRTPWRLAAAFNNRNAIYALLPLR
jgi:hypothetical protein